jgi:alpha-D-ribose 1-methylphosphonate 5-triphosphate diphosphatase
MPLLPPFRITGARVLRDGAFTDEPLTLYNGRITEGRAPDIDLSGYLVLPGIVDLHGDAFERHLAPRPSAPFELADGLRSAATELAANGVTTAWLAQSWSWEGGFRSADAAEAVLDALERVRDGLLPDVRLQIRLETHVLPEHPRLLDAVRRHRIDYVVFNNHLPEARELAEGDAGRFASWAALHRRTPEEHLGYVRRALEMDAEVPFALPRLARELLGMGVRLGSHDDATPEMRAFYREIGARICEFPTSRDAAEAARAAGDPILMGAPNVVRGGSQSGNIGAEALLAAGLCDALVSDYHYPALAWAAFRLADAGTLSFAGAWETISSIPAEIAGLSDRGRLSEGARADLVVVDPRTRKIEATIVAGHVAHLCGGAAARFVGSFVLSGRALASV